MKKLVTLLLCLCLAFSTVGCQAGSIESTAWIDESAAKIGEDISSGQFVLDGVVYQFPMPLQQWLDNGWHISNSYDNIDEFTLGEGESSSSFELFNEDDAYVRVAVLNTTAEEVKVEQCMVNYLYLPLTEVDAVFPKGLTKRNKPADIIAAYGEPLSRGDESGSFLEALYSYVDDDAWQCYVELGAFDNDYTIDPLTSVEYSVMSFGDYWDSLVESVGTEEACKIFVDTTMKTSYWGDFTEYLEYAIDSESGATGLYESEIAYYSEFLMYYVDVNSEYVSDDIKNRFAQIARDVLAKVSWNIVDIEIDQFDEGIMTIEICPTNFLTLIDADVDAAIDQFGQKYAEVDFESMTDEEYAVVEEDYGIMVLDAIEKRVSEAGTLEAVQKQYELDIDDSVIKQEDWEEIDDVIMNIIE